MPIRTTVFTATILIVSNVAYSQAADQARPSLPPYGSFGGSEINSSAMTRPGDPALYHLFTNFDPTSEKAGRYTGLVEQHPNLAFIRDTAYGIDGKLIPGLKALYVQNGYHFRYDHPTGKWSAARR